MVKVGWMVDAGLPRAGMILSVEAFASGAEPRGYTLHECPSDRRPPDDIDVFVMHGDLYDRRWIDVLRRKPFMAHRHGGWFQGDPVFRRWVLDNATLVTFNSPKQRSLFPYPVNAREGYVPLPLNLDAINTLALERPWDEREHDLLFLGFIHPAKGVNKAMDWALRNSETIHFYGELAFKGMLTQIVEPWGQYMGPVDYERVPDLLTTYKRLVFMPYEPDIYCRVVLEAIAAECELITDGDTQSLWDWFNPDACQDAVETFWNAVDMTMELFAMELLGG